MVSNFSVCWCVAVQSVCFTVCSPSEHVHMGKMSWDKAVSDVRQVFTQAKSLARVTSDLCWLGHLRRRVSTL